MSDIDLSVIFDKISQGSLSRGDVPDVTLAKKKTLRKMIVMEVISDAKSNAENEENVQRWESIRVSNIRYARFLPRNTIVAKDIGVESDPEFVLPFFSHLGMPCKAGESVWVIAESQESDMSYWLSRVVELNIADDVNHSHPGRYLDSTQNPGSTSRFGNTPDSTWFELRNGPDITLEGVRNTSSKLVLLKGEPEDIFEQLVTGSKAAEISYYESVPRFKKRPGDVVLEGSNNTLVVLGNDRTGPLEKTKFKDSAGSIDLVVGRGQTSETFGKSVDTTSILGIKETKASAKVIKTEIDKTSKSLSSREGDPDLVNDRSRILASHRTIPDKNFGLESYNQKLEIKDDSSNGDAAIVIKTDKIRLIARSDIEILVTGFKDTLRESPDKKKVKDEETDQSKWASITINSKGEIVIKPSEKSLLKLGGEDADKAILCSSQIPVEPGKVTGAPITDTMGGNIGVAGSSITGVFSSKVLIK